MKQLGKLTPAFLLCLGLLGCTNDTFVEEPNVTGSGNNGSVKNISVTLPEIPSDANTRTAFKISETKVTSLWVEKDTIGIFPEIGDQVAFPIVNGASSNIAIFDGGGWGLKASYAYAAYYPFNTDNYFRDNKTILIDYTGQTQEGNDNATHLGAYDYLASGQMRPNSSGSLNLEMQRLGSLLMLELVVPRSETYTSLTLTSSEANFIKKAELDISGPEPQIIEKETSPIITLPLRDVSLEAGEILRAYLMCAPVDLTSGTLSVALSGKALYATELEPKNLKAGKPYKFSGSPVFSVGFIEFADSLVKQICVSQWDTDNDGELNYQEAAAVTEIPAELFREKTITSFDELMYFTNVNKIGESAFLSCNKMTSINIPDGVTEIERYAFENCSNLTSITLPDAVTSIRSFAFDGCTNLTSINIPDGVTEIGIAAFQFCRKLTSITLPSGLTSIEDYVFSTCNNLTSITLPDGVLSLGSYAFANCSSLTSIDIPDGVTSIGNGTFSGCSSLTSIDIPDGVTSIGNKAFRKCSSLTSIYIPDGVTSIEEYAFENCSNLTSINIPDGVTFIGNGAFSGCSSLTSITLPSGVTSIGNGAFSNCSNLTSINIPSRVTYIGYSAFESCINLTSIYIPNGVTSIGEKTFYKCSSLTSINISNGVTSIGDYAFYYCTGLTSITLPDGVTSIGNFAFYYCNNLERITCNAISPPVIETTPFHYSYCSIYVPASSVATYKADTGWKSYSNRIQAIQ